MKRFLPYISFLLLFASCSTQNYLMESDKEKKALLSQLDTAFFYNPQYQYQLRVDDKINISVWGQEDLSVGSVYSIYNSNEVYGKWLLVDMEGNIEIPKVGTTNVKGMTIIEIKKMLKSKFGEWVVNPIVDVKVLNKEITILGEVRNPGVLQVDKDRNTLLEIIAKSGGIEDYADLGFVKVLRQEGEHVRVAGINLTKSGDFAQKNIQLHPGDVVIVPSKGHKEFDRRVSTIIPFTTTITAAAILMGTF